MSAEHGSVREDTGGSRRLYRDPQRGIVLGVCAGLADYFGFHVKGTRILVAIALLFFFPTILILYFALALVLPKKPAGPPETPSEDALQRRVRAEPHATLGSIRHRFRELDGRLQQLEKYVTSKHFKLDREFKKLQE